MNLIEEISRRHPSDAVAVISGGRSVTYGELFDGASEVAAEIRNAARPLQRHPRIGLHCPDGLDYIILAMGILLADACLVPLAEELTAEEREEITHTTSLDFTLDGKPDHGGHVLKRLKTKPPAFPEDDFQALNPAFIRFSSGTTGTSKGVVLSHETLLARITAANEGLKIGPDDKVLWMLPLAHHFAVSIVLYLYAGAVTVLEPSPAREDILAAAEAHEATVMYGAPFHYAMLGADTGSFRWPSLRLAVATAAALPEATARAFEQRFDQALVQGLGIIEVGLSVLNLEDAASTPTAIGRALPAYEVALLDPSGNPVAEGEAGEFHIRGPGLLDAYLVPWDPAPLRDGYFASGDLVVRHSDGLLTLVGRSKSVINVAGMKVFPEEVESVLNLHPEVEASRVVGKDHPHTGQIPIAEIIPRDPANPPKAIALQRYCREHLSAYKVPLRFKPVDHLPRTASGKIRRV
ncbi:class I adenylate-forming enzyme family protein [Haloferula rosea]|uniref:AMP-binding protein n=1 Tax=Haloferula rosea TaxID=490093 RepID=A0A934REA7_9BACT|nr:AMP-binding protein [Haloferula rosea]MBK1828088.1 AMP-binding protein [Haloferula rosea]